MGNKSKISFLVIGDIIALYAALFVTLVVRYSHDWFNQFEDIHATPFSIIFVVWLIIFFIAGLYDLRRLRDNLEFVKTLWLAILTSAIVSTIIFYIIPAFGIAPKTNLLIFVVIFGIIETLWRRGFNRSASSGSIPNRVLLIGNDGTAEIEKTVGDNEQLGYEICAHLGGEAAAHHPDAIESLVREKNINCVVVSRRLKQEGHLPAALFRLFGKGILIMDLPNFYETIMRKVPLDELEETWFLENIESTAQLYDPLKQAWEFVVALIVGIVLLPIELLIAILVAASSRGPVIYRQTRTGKNGREFMLYKFRSMRALAADGSAETSGAQWAAGTRDPRITAIGRFLRASHLDELPQLWNVLRGDISFVGPRPERPEWIAKLEKEIPYYETRLLVKPGISGWAQLNHRADLTTADVREKLQYDIYYLKNRSLILDLAIIVKTLKSFFVNPE